MLGPGPSSSDARTPTPIIPPALPSLNSLHFGTIFVHFLTLIEEWGCNKGKGDLTCPHSGKRPATPAAVPGAGGGAQEHRDREGAKGQRRIPGRSGSSSVVLAVLPNHLPSRDQHHYLCIIFPPLDVGPVKEPEEEGPVFLGLREGASWP